MKKKRARIPALLLILVVAVCVLLAVWGNWADPDARNPSSAADGIVTQIFQPAGESKRVRCAVILDRPAEDVWGVVTGYDRFSEVFPLVSDVKAKVEADGHHHLTFTVGAILGGWDVDVRVKHEETPEGFRASWDEPGGDLTTNRGSWSVLRRGEKQTLLVYSLEVKVAPFPDSFTRAALRSQMRSVVASVRDYRPST